MLFAYIKLLRDLFSDEEGASAVEYGLILGLIAVVIILVLTAVGTNLNSLFTTASDKLGTAAGS